MKPLVFVSFSLILASLSFLYFLNHKSSVISPIFVPISTKNPPTPTSVPPSITIGLVGDLGLGRHITATARQKNNFNWSFQEIVSWLNSNDFNLANLESPIIKNCPPGPTGTFRFCGDERFVPYLKQYNFVFNLNNNHILNYGLDGLEQTKNFLSNDYFFDNFYIKEINGLKFGFLGYDFITYPSTDTNQIINKIGSVRPQVDYLIVSIHWGNEYLPQPEKWRINLAHQMIDAGADIVHGHHPHVWQGIEEYNQKLIFYSFGNFIFDQSWSYETSHSQIAKVTFQKNHNPTYQLFPIKIIFNSQPALMP